LHHPKEILWVVFPSNDDASKIAKPSEQTLDFPTLTVAAQHAAILRGFPAARGVVWSEQFDTEAFANLPSSGSLS